MTNRIVLMLALVLLAGCSKPQAVTDLKASITALRAAGDGIAQSDYHGLVIEAQTRLKSAHDQLSAEDARACDDALAKAADVDLLWRDTDGIVDGLTPVAQEPLTRLGVVKNRSDFGRWETNFMALQRSVDGEGAADTPEIEQKRDDLRHELIRQAMAAAAPALKKAEQAL